MYSTMKRLVIDMEWEISVDCTVDCESGGTANRISSPRTQEYRVSFLVV